MQRIGLPGKTSDPPSYITQRREETNRLREDDSQYVPSPCKAGKCLILLARPEGFEPPTLGSEVRCSVQLSYGRARQMPAVKLPV
jgi:hypothetical protein